MKAVAPSDWPVPIRDLWHQLPLAPLGPGQPVRAVKASIESSASSWPASYDRTMVAACQAGLWLGFNFHDESHAISQDLDTVEGSYWHAILHRREPDAANAAYWFRRVGDHPIFTTLASEAPRLGLHLKSPGWDPFEFINLCEKHRDTSTEQEEVLRKVQQNEFRLLWMYCYIEAMRSAPC